MFDVDAVLHYWFGPLKDYDDYPTIKSKIWFRKSDSTDEFIAKTFGGQFDRIASLPHTTLLADARTALASIVFLDQFPRNCFRGDAEAYDYDREAQQLTKKGIEAGFDRELKLIERAFFYMPLMHAETKSAHKLSLKLYKQLCADASEKFQSKAEGFLDFAQRHAKIVEEFGRYPHRNEILGRKTTEAEEEFLKKPGSSF